MAEQLHQLPTFEQNETAPPDKKVPSGLSDWKRMVEAVGERSLAGFIESMDPGNPGTVNAHRAIAKRVEALRMPGQRFISASVGDFADNPGLYLDQLAHGDYYFLSIRPGIHLAHAEDAADVVAFVRGFAASHPSAADQNLELYLSRNAEPVLSGHIIVRDDAAPNTIDAEFTNRDFVPFHRGLRTPEIHVHRSRNRFEWEFGSELAAPDGDWRTDEQFICNSGVRLSRPDMAHKIFSAIQCVPHDGDTYLPGYYEVLLELSTGTGTRATFVEAVTAKSVLRHL